VLAAIPTSENPVSQNLGWPVVLSTVCDSLAGNTQCLCGSMCSSAGLVEMAASNVR